MTYEEALETWARKRFPDIPADISRLSLVANHEPLNLVWEFANGSCDYSDDLNSWVDALDQIIREIVNTALGVIE